MFRLHIVALLLAGAAYTQTAPPKVNGKQMTEAEFQALLNTIPPQSREAVQKNPTQLLQNYGFIDRLVELAEESGFTTKSPNKELVTLLWKQALAQTFMNQ